MYSSKLPSPINVISYTAQSDIDQALFNHFMNDLSDPKTRPTLFGKFIFINFKNWIDRKSAVFWHLASLNESERFNVLPCTNCISSTICPTNCSSMERVIQFADGEKRTFCMYRGMRINWISEIIRLANEEDPSIESWKKTIVTGNTPRVQQFIRFTHEAADYVLIFEEKQEKGDIKLYFFVTAFPVFYINAKRQYSSEYEEYKTNLKVETIKNR